MKLHVHHKTYKNLGYEEIEDVTVLCSVCHAKEHRIKYSKEQKRFTKFYREIWEEISNKKILSPSESYLLLLVFPYCKTNSCELEQDGIPLDLSDIAQIINREERQVRRIIKSLTDKNMIAKVESGCCYKFCINPELFWNGGDITQYTHFRTMFYSIKENKLKDIKNEIKVLSVNGRKSSINF